jgi:hypothetical protein
MPRSLIDRCQHDSIYEFTAAASQRWHDAISLLRQERKTGAIYLFGYVAEMTLKAAYFRFVGFPSATAITRKDLDAARGWAKVAGIAWQGNLHSLSSWAELLVTRRQTTAGGAYPIVGFGTQILTHAQTLQRHWSELLRYHKNTAYDHECRSAHEIADWFRNRFQML